LVVVSGFECSPPKYAQNGSAFDHKTKTWRLLHNGFHAIFDSVKWTENGWILALSLVLAKFGPQLGRPRVDTLKGSRHVNIKELRFSAADGEWRVAFAFDPGRRAILLVAGDKSGGSEKRFYRVWVRT
jgi:hypothetical protein